MFVGLNKKISSFFVGDLPNSRFVCAMCAWPFVASNPMLRPIASKQERAIETRTIPMCKLGKLLKKMRYNVKRFFCFNLLFIVFRETDKRVLHNRLYYNMNILKKESTLHWILYFHICRSVLWHDDMYYWFICTWCANLYMCILCTYN